MSERILPVRNVRVYRLGKRDSAEMLAQPDKGRMVRLYTVLVDSRPEGNGGSYALQIRAPLGIGAGGRKDGKDFAIAHAVLNGKELRELRAAIDRQLAEGGPR